MRKSRRLLIALALVSAIISSSGCATEYVYLRPQVAIPDRPAKVIISADALQCLGDQAYESLVLRDARKDAHIDRLEAIIRAVSDPVQN